MRAFLSKHRYPAMPVRSETSHQTLSTSEDLNEDALVSVSSSNMSAEAASSYGPSVLSDPATAEVELVNPHTL